MPTQGEGGVPYPDSQGVTSPKAFGHDAHPLARYEPQFYDPQYQFTVGTFGGHAYVHDGGPLLFAQLIQGNGVGHAVGHGCKGQC